RRELSHGLADADHVVGIGFGHRTTTLRTAARNISALCPCRAARGGQRCGVPVEEPLFRATRQRSDAGVTGVFLGGLDDPARGVEVLLVVAGHGDDLDGLAASGRVDDLVVADIEGDMARPGVEKDQVTWAELGTGYRFALGGLVGGRRSEERRG